MSLVQWVKGLEFESSGSFCFTIISLQLFMKYFLKMISHLLSFHTLHRKNQSLMRTNYFEKSFLSFVYMFSYIDIFFSRVFIKEIRGLKWNYSSYDWTLVCCKWPWPLPLDWSGLCFKGVKLGCRHNCSSAVMGHCRYLWTMTIRFFKIYHSSGPKF